MKLSTKILAVAFVAAIALVIAVPASAAGFTQNLTVGSTGAEVTQLQTVLGVTPVTGYFGPITKAAVVKYQVANGVPGTGYVGPLTRGVLNGAAPVTNLPAGCVAGGLFSSTTGVPCTSTTTTLPAGCVAGALFSSTTGVACTSTTVVANGTDGSLTASKSSTVSSGAQIKKGETKDIVAVKLQATVGAVSINRFDVSFDTRPWLYFSSIQLKGTNGTVIASKSNLTAADFTELTIGTEYLLRFDGLNFAVTPSQTETLTVAGTVLSSTDKLASNKNIAVTASGIRTINGKGYTDTPTISGTPTNTVTLLSTGSNGAIDERINVNSPATRIVTTSTTGQTNNVEVMRFDLKSENANSTVNALNLAINTSAGNSSSTVAAIFKSVKLTVDGTTYNADEIGTLATFTDLSINLSTDVWKTVVVTADVADQDEFTNGTVASSSLVASSVKGVDASYNDLTVNTTSNIVANEMTFNKNGVAVSSMSATATVSPSGSGVASKASVAMGFTLTNGSNNDLFISKSSYTAVATSTTASSSVLSLMSATSATLAGDTTNFYQIPSGSSRVFTLNGVMDNTNGTYGAKEFKITNIYFTDATTNTTVNAQKYNIGFGLEALKAVTAI